jgi:hypothetical protein
MVPFQIWNLNIIPSKYFNISFDVNPSVISSVIATDVGSNSVNITWETDKQSNSKVNYGTTKSLGFSKSSNDFVWDHRVKLTGLSSDTKYYYEVVSYDLDGLTTTDDNKGNYYSFTTGEGDDGGDGGDGGGGSGGGGGDSNISYSPIANAGGPYYGKINQSIYFDASESNDPDGFIVSYTWDFGDGTEIITENTGVSHEYSSIGNYAIELTVVDNEGLTDSDTTFINISSDDNDEDGWSNEAEEYYNTDPNNSSDYPVDSDNDGVPDDWDPDDDNDGLTDTEEEKVGTSKNDNIDVIRIINMYGAFYLLDTNSDNIFDVYYNQETGATTELYKVNETSFLIDIDNDGIYDYIYSTPSGEIKVYEQPDTQDAPFDYTLFIIILVVIIVIITIILFIRRGK